MSIYKGEQLLAGSSGGGTSSTTYLPPLLQPSWFDHLVEDMSWLRADTFSWHDGNTYKTVYNKLVEEYATGTEETEGTTTIHNCTVVGTPYITDNLRVNGFSNSNYLKVPSTISLGTNFEVFVKFKTPYTMTTGQGIFTGLSNPYISIGITSTCKIDYNVGNGSAWITGDNNKGKTTITGDTTYYVKITFNGSVYKGYISTDNSTWTEDWSCSSTTVIPAFTGLIGNGRALSNPFYGLIYLKDCYIKKNGDYFWKGYKTKDEGITFKRTSSQFKIVDPTQEQAILNKYTNDGIAWYYILDTTNKRFKLPRTKFGFEGLRDKAGKDIAESLPNIKGTINSTGYRGDGALFSDGVFTSSSILYSEPYAGHTSYSGWRIPYLNFNASDSSSTYQNNAPVQERATQMYLYFYVGEFSKTAIEQTAGLNSEMFNGKVDINLGNFPKPYLKTSYVSGTSGYRIWSDGYCEQWGKASISSNTYAATTVQLLKTMLDTNYNISIGGVNKTLNGNYIFTVGGIITNSSFNIWDECTTGENHENDCCWKVSGYLASDQY